MLTPKNYNNRIDKIRQRPNDYEALFNMFSILNKVTIHEISKEPLPRFNEKSFLFMPNPLQFTQLECFCQK